jgi:hypothetical protein
MPLAYSEFIYWSGEESGFTLWQVLAFDTIYLLYLGVIAVGIL